MAISRRVPRSGPTEFSRLARSINRMTARILEEQAQRTHLEKVASVGRSPPAWPTRSATRWAPLAATRKIPRKSSVLDSDARDAVAGIQREECAH